MVQLFVENFKNTEMGKMTRTQLLTASRVRGLHVGGNKPVLEARLEDWAKKNGISNFDVNDISCLLQDLL